MTTPLYTQAAYRFYEDGTEAGSVALGSQDTALTRNVAADSNILARFRIQNTNATVGVSTDDYQLQRLLFRQGAIETATGWVNVDASSNAVKGFNSANLTDGGATTGRLTAGTGSFVAGEVSEDGLVDDDLITASNYTEFVYSLTLVANDLADGDQIRLRVLRNGSALSAYTVIATLNIVKNSTGFGALKGVLRVGAASITNPASPVGSVSVALKDIVVVGISEQTNLTAGAVTDNLGNTYTAINAGTDGGNTCGRGYFSVVTVAGTLTQVDIVATASTLNYSAVAAAFEGPFKAAPLDANPANTSTDITTPYVFPATGVLAQADELIIGIAAMGSWSIGTTGNVATVGVTAPDNLIACQSDFASGSVQQITLISRVVAVTTDVSQQFVASVDPGSVVYVTASFMKDAAVVWSDMFQDPIPFITRPAEMQGY